MNNSYGDPAPAVPPTDLQKQKPKRNRASLLSIFFIAGMVLSCDYHLVREPDVSMPASVQSVSIPLAANHTIEAGLEDVFTMELIKRLSADGRAEIREPGRGESELRCSINDLDTRPISYTREGRVAAQRVVISAECMISVPESGSVVWKSGLLTAGEEYAVGDDYLVNEQARAQAILEACRDLAESVRNLLLDPF